MPLRKIEFWLATLALVLWSAIILFRYSEGDFRGYTLALADQNPMHLFFRTAGSLLLLGLIVYGTFLFLNLYVFSALYRQKKWDLVITYTLLTYLAFALTLYSVMGYSSVFHHWQFLPATTITLSLFSLYLLAKKLGNYFIYRVTTGQGPLRQLGEEAIWAVVFWLFVLVLLSNYTQSWLLHNFWAFMVPASYLVFRLNTHWLLPQHEREGKDRFAYWSKAILLSFMISCCFGIFFGRGNMDGFVLFWALQSLLVTPFAYLMYKQGRRQRLQLHALQTSLGQTTADLQQLRSQINPHFLFNALNTLYGTALQEGSDRTAEGIQKLGDMMRFMLHENLQDSIPLEKEKEYLRNYIDLQLLRIQSSELIDIQISIPQQHHPYQLAPMLLIPFVENAFKHGISLKQKSWIKVVLSCDDQHLYFDIYNSLHTKSGTDPEKHYGGIGLENVRQRLALLYPHQHELIIRKTAEEFIVHLTLTLSPARPLPLQPVAEQQVEASPSIALTKG